MRHPPPRVRFSARFPLFHCHWPSSSPACHAPLHCRFCSVSSRLCGYVFFLPLTVSHNRCSGPSVSPLSPLAPPAATLRPALCHRLPLSALSPAEGAAHPVTDARRRRAIRLPPCVQRQCLSFDSSSSVGTQGRNDWLTNCKIPQPGQRHPSRHTCFFYNSQQCKIRTTTTQWSLFFMRDGSRRAVNKNQKQQQKQ